MVAGFGGTNRAVFARRNFYNLEKMTIKISDHEFRIVDVEYHIDEMPLNPQTDECMTSYVIDRITYKGKEVKYTKHHLQWIYDDLYLINPNKLK